MVNGFVGGVRDSQGQRGYVEVAPGEVVAIDLAKGVALWRRERIGRPIAATAQRLMTLDWAGERVVLRLFDAASGADAGRIDNLGMPDWAAKTGLAPDALQVEASEVPGGVRLQWNLRQLYRGGAPPPPHITSRAQEEVTGAAIVDPNTSRITPATPAPPVAPRTTASVRDASPDPNVFALDRVGATVFALKAKGAGVVLEARDARHGTALWELPLVEQRAGRPTPQRM
jgi:hypothetical protein